MNKNKENSLATTCFSIWMVPFLGVCSSGYKWIYRYIYNIYIYNIYIIYIYIYILYIYIPTFGSYFTIGNTRFFSPQLQPQLVWIPPGRSWKNCFHCWPVPCYAWLRRGRSRCLGVSLRLRPMVCIRMFLMICEIRYPFFCFEMFWHDLWNTMHIYIYIYI